MTSDVNGTKVDEQGTYPFGGTWYSTGLLPKQKFTSYEREAGAQSAGDLDYAVFRYHYPRLGRFTSPDPVAGSIIDPQSLNRYAYSRNDPINLTDPLGLTFDQYCAWYPGDTALCPPLTDKNAGGGFGWYGGGPGGSGLGWVGPYNDGHYSTYNPFGAWNSVPLGTILGSPQPIPIWTFTLASTEPTHYDQELNWVTPSINSGGGPFNGGPARDLVQLRLEELLELVASDPDCLAFLGQGALGTLDGILRNGLFGVEIISPVPTAGGGTSIVNAVSSAFEGQAITVNFSGAFFYGSFGGSALTTNRGRISGGTTAAQGFLLLHELAHLTGAIGHDYMQQGAVDKNDKDLSDHCKHTIAGFRR